MAQVTILEPIVDTAGAFQSDYAVQVSLDNVTKSQNNAQTYRGCWDEMNSVLHFTPQVDVPRLADVLGQSMKTDPCSERISKYVYVDIRRPAGQAVYDAVLAAEIVMAAAPEIGQITDYTICDENTPNTNSHSANIKWQHKQYPTFFVSVLFPENKEQHEKEIRHDEYLIVKDRTPESTFESVSFYGEVPFSKHFKEGLMKKTNVPALLNLMLGDDVRFVSKKDNTLSLEKVLSNNRLIGISSYGVRMPKPTSMAISDAVVFAEAIETFSRENSEKLYQLGENLKEVENIAVRMGIHEDVFHRGITYETSLSQRIVARVRTEMEAILEETIGTLRTIPHTPTVPEIFLRHNKNDIQADIEE